MVFISIYFILQANKNSKIKLLSNCFNSINPKNIILKIYALIIEIMQNVQKK